MEQGILEIVKTFTAYSKYIYNKSDVIDSI